MTNHDHIVTLKVAADPRRVAVALGLRCHGLRFRQRQEGGEIASQSETVSGGRRMRRYGLRGLGRLNERQIEKAFSSDTERGMICLS